MTGGQIKFEVNALAFCKVLQAVALFQARPQDFSEYARVHCYARHDGLLLSASNGSSAAIARVDVDELAGSGGFELPAGQVKALLAVFKRPVPKDFSSDEYVLEVSADEHLVRVKDISDLFDHDELVLAVQATDVDNPHMPAPGEMAMSLAATMMRTVQDALPLDLTSGVYFSPDEVERIAKAAKILGRELYLRPQGRSLTTPISDDFYASTVAQHSEHDRKPPFRDARAVHAWDERLHELVNLGVM